MDDNERFGTPVMRELDRQLERFETQAEAKVQIWSFEHNAWWAPNERGYTKDRAQAGLYDRVRAEKICADANTHRPDDSPDEEICLVSGPQPSGETSW